MVNSSEMPLKKFYEDDNDLIVKLRRYIVENRTQTQFANVIIRKYKNALTEEHHDVLYANPLLDAYLKGSNAFALLIIADILHNLKLSVSYEIFTRETGFDPFDPKITDWAAKEINRLRSTAGNEDVDALVQPLVWSLQNKKDAKDTKETKNVNYSESVWKELGVNPQMLHDMMCGIPAAKQNDESVDRPSREQTPTCKRKIPLYQRVSSRDLNNLNNNNNEKDL